jgi:hypothetical protein
MSNWKDLDACKEALLTMTNDHQAMQSLFMDLINDQQPLALTRQFLVEWTNTLQTLGSMELFKFSIESLANRQVSFEAEISTMRFVM